MTQSDVHANPVAAARRAYPYVVVLQSPLADVGRSRVVAPLVPRAKLPAAAGRLVPTVAVRGVDHAVLVPALTAIPARELGASIASVSSARTELLSAVDLLFFGV